MRKRFLRLLPQNHHLKGNATFFIASPHGLRQHPFVSSTLLQWWIWRNSCESRHFFV